MGLDFTTIKDQPGPAVFLLHDGTEQDEKDFQKLAETIHSRTKKQIIIMSADGKIGRSVIQFYQLKGSHFVLIVRDDDQLHHVWSDGERFDPSQIAYIAEQVS